MLESMMASLERLEKISTEYDRCRSRAETYRTYPGAAETSPKRRVNAPPITRPREGKT